MRMTLVFLLRKITYIPLYPSQNPQEAGLRFPEMEKGSCPWSVVAKEAEALAHLTENARCSSLRAIASKENKHVKGIIPHLKVLQSPQCD